MCIRDSRKLVSLEQAIGAPKIALLRELGVLDSLIKSLPTPSCNIVVSEVEPSAMIADNFVETDIVLTLNSRCCDHICDIADTPGYAPVLVASPGSKSGQKFVVGNGDRVANQGQVKLKMQGKDKQGLLMSSVFQVAEITRPLMSVSRICDQNMVCIFEKTHARIVTEQGETVARFDRDGGLYTCTMKLRKPDPVDNPSVFGRQDA